MERQNNTPNGYNDLHLSEEGSSANRKLPQTRHLPPDYIGYELESALEAQTQNRQTRRLTIIFFCMSLLIVFALIASKNNNRGPRNNSYGKGGSHHSSGLGGSGHHSGNHQGNHHTSSGNHHHRTPQPSPSPDDETSEEVDVDTVINFWPTSAPLPSFEICKPKLSFKHHQRIAHLTSVTIVPEANNAKDDDDWEYTFSDLDISDEASIIAVGLSDFSSNTDYELGMVRVFAHACSHRKFGVGKWKQLGQDLLGGQQYDAFGASVSTSLDGKVMAISATQNEVDDDDANGYVEVYYLDTEDQNELTDQMSTWKKIGQRIEGLDDVEDYYNLGLTIDLSDDGENLAVLGAISENEFITRVFGYNANDEKWVSKGDDITVKLDADNEFDFTPKVTLNGDGTTISVLDPKFGMVQYDFKSGKNKWIQNDYRIESDDDIFIENLSFDESASVVAYSAFGTNNATDNDQVIVKLFDFTNGTAKEFYNDTFSDLGVGFGVDVSQDGFVAAVVAYRVNMDDGYQWDYEDVGSLTILSKNMDGKWKVLGKGTKEEGMAVPGSMVTLSRDGSMAAIGTNEFISLYGISLNHDPNNMTQVNPGDKPVLPTIDTVNEMDNTTETSNKNETEITVEDSTDNTTEVSNENVTDVADFFHICAPYPHATKHNVGKILDLPHSNYSEDEHPISLKLSGDGSIVVVGIDSFEEELRGMVRAFGYNCATRNYTKLGQDLFGREDLDGFGQSVDLSANGTVLVVGANQPAPGKSGYVDIYNLVKGLWVLDERFEEVHDNVEDIGREVCISSDGSTIAIHGSVVENQEEIAFLSSFVRIIEKKNETWVPKGDDLIESILYDEYGTNVKLAFAADGQTLGIVGSYNTFSVKLYEFNETLQNWTETVIPSFKSTTDDENENESSDYEFDNDMESYFDGTDIALSDDGNTIAVVGTQWEDDFSMISLLTVDGGNWTIPPNMILGLGDDAYTPTAIDISGDATVLAVGLSMGDSDEKGQLSVNQRDHSKNGWKNLGILEGENEMDMLGSRIGVSSDGIMVAASSRRGYITLFKV